MKKLFCSFLLAGQVYAQQSLFNVPSGEATAYGKYFFQEQVSGASRSVQFNSTTCYGVTEGFEVGLDVYGVTLDLTGNPPPSPTGLATALFATEVTEGWRSSFGIQAGTILGSAFGKQLAGMLYTIQRVTLPAEIQLYLGGYVATTALTGSSTDLTANYLLGLEVPLIGDLTFVADRVAGHHTIGENVIGFAYAVNPFFILSLGVQIPNSDFASYAGVFELTLTQF